MTQKCPILYQTTCFILYLKEGKTSVNYQVHWQSLFLRYYTPDEMQIEFAFALYTTEKIQSVFTCETVIRHFVVDIFDPSNVSRGIGRLHVGMTARL